MCRRPAAARGKPLNAPGIRGLLRLVEDDTAALRDFHQRILGSMAGGLIPALSRMIHTGRRFTSS